MMECGGEGEERKREKGGEGEGGREGQRRDAEPKKSPHLAPGAPRADPTGTLGARAAQVQDLTNPAGKERTRKEYNI